MKDKNYEIILLSFQLDLESIVAGKTAIGNMLGGIGYFYGQSKISSPRDSNVSHLIFFFFPSCSRRRRRQLVIYSSKGYLLICFQFLRKFNRVRKLKRLKNHGKAKGEGENR